MSYTSIKTDYMKKKQKNTKKLDVFAMMVKHMIDMTPIKQNSGRGVVPDSTVSRIQDIYNEGKKENEWK